MSAKKMSKKFLRLDAEQMEARVNPDVTISLVALGPIGSNAGFNYTITGDPNVANQITLSTEVGPGAPGDPGTSGVRIVGNHAGQNAPLNVFIDDSNGLLQNEGLFGPFKGFVVIGGAAADTIDAKALGGVVNGTPIGGNTRHFVVVNAGGGNDTIFSGAQADQLNGEGGNDTVNANGSDFPDGVNDSGAGITPIVTGGGGNDVLNVGSNAGETNTIVVDGFETVNGGAGNDNIIAGAGNTVITGGEGNDTLQGGAGNDTLTGGGGVDVISYFNSPAGVRVLLGEAADGSDTLAAGGDANTDRFLDRFEGVLGSDGFADTIYGNSFDNLLDGAGGDDSIFGLGGNDTVIGGQGADLLQGNGGNDLVFGDDQGVVQNINRDNVDTGLDNITEPGGGAADDINGGDGNDTLYGQAGDDFIEGSRGNDLINGGTGNDGLDGGRGNDDLDGATGDDLIDGGLGADTFRLNAGPLAGDPNTVDPALLSPNDVYVGGGDADVYSVHNAWDTLTLVGNVNVRRLNTSRVNFMTLYIRNGQQLIIPAQNLPQTDYDARFDSIVFVVP